MTAAFDLALFASSRFVGLADLLARLPAGPSWPTMETLNHCYAPEFAVTGVHMLAAPKTKARHLADGTIDPASLYEVGIIATKVVPSRAANLHDLLNALMWAAFPRSKLALTTVIADLQRTRVQGQARLPGTRAPRHNQLALLDEGGLLQTAAGTCHIFGHAILEHAAEGRSDVRAALVPLAIPMTTRAAVDEALAVAIATDTLIIAPGAGVPIDDTRLVPCL